MKTADEYIYSIAFWGRSYITIFVPSMACIDPFVLWQHGRCNLFFHIFHTLVHALYWRQLKQMFQFCKMSLAPTLKGQ